MRTSRPLLFASLALTAAACGGKVVFDGDATSTSSPSSSSSSTMFSTTSTGGAPSASVVGVTVTTNVVAVSNVSATVSASSGFGGESISSSSVVTSSSTGGFMTAPHDALPQVPDNGGRELTNVELVTVSFAGYPYESDVQTFDDWIVSSDWLTTVGADYGVGTGTSAGHVVVNEAPPSTISDDQIQTWITQHIADGTLPAPAPSATSNDTLYMIYYPESTSIELQGAESCVGFGGYHNSIDTSAMHVSYAVLPLCTQGVPDLLAELQIAASHELIEAATDASPITDTAGYTIIDPSDPWAYVGGEVADLCSGLSTADGPYTLQQIWSNTAAAAGKDPCIPSNEPYFDTNPSPSGFVSAHAGQQISINLTGWSTAPMADWFLVSQSIQGTFTPNVSFNPTTINNGQTSIMTIGIPAGTAPGNYAALEIFSVTQTEYTGVPLIVEVQ